MGKLGNIKQVSNITYFFHASPMNTLAYHRVIGPAKILGLNVIPGFIDGQIEVDRVSDGDIVVMQRDFPRFFKAYERIIALAHEEDKPVILDFDDLLFQLPEGHPDRKGFDYTEALLPMLQALIEADMITVATAPLQEYFLSFNRNVHILPNYLNDSLWTLRRPTKPIDQDQPIVIGYMGGDSHLFDLQMLVPTILELINRFPNKLQFIFWGIAPPKEIAGLTRSIHIPLDIHEYPKFVSCFQKQSADIFIAPLVENLFNSCKSAIKFLEYSALGISGVYSNIQPYSSVITDGYDGLLASTPNEWLDHLTKLIEHPERRTEIASNAQKTIRNNWLLSKNASLWLDVYQRAHTPKSLVSSKRPMISTLRSIVLQSVEMQKLQDENAHTLTTKVSELDAQVQLLNSLLSQHANQVTRLTEEASLRTRQVQLVRERIMQRELQNQELTARVIQFEHQVDELNTKLREITVSMAWRVAMLLRGAWNSLFTPGSWRERLGRKAVSSIFIPLDIRRNIRTRKDIGMIRDSRYFNEGWYLAHNTDVAQANIDPAQHYLIHGGFEGRDPGPDFDTRWYLETYLDVKLAGVNPLLHYLKFGQSEGRARKSDTFKEFADKGENANDFSTPPEQDMISRTSIYTRSEKVPDRYSMNYLDTLSIAQGSLGSDYEPFASESICIGELPAHLIAFYLPQFHPIPENDEWWGKGFTEWTNVSKAIPQFVGHYQPHLPGELGFYDLRVPEVQRRQVKLAKQSGIYGFCFYYYWFDGKRLLEQPLEQFVSDPEIDLPFCLCWANENWTRRWDGLDSEILIAQSHSEDSDFRFMRDIMPYFRSARYIHIDDRPLLLVYRVNILSNPLETTNHWRELTIAEGLGNPFLVAAQVFGYQDNPEELGFDAALEFPPNTLSVANISKRFTLLDPSFDGYIYDYQELSRRMKENFAPDYTLFKTVMPSWDNTARHPTKPSIFMNASPKLYEDWLTSAIRFTQSNLPQNRRFVFINAWNEWAEGTHLEPDRKYGYAYLNATKNALRKTQTHRGNWKLLFISHDAHLGGAQLCLLSIARWFIDHTDVDVKMLCLEGGKLLPEFDQLGEVLLYTDIAHLSERDRIDRLIQFCAGSPDLIYANTVASGRVYSWLVK